MNGRLFECFMMINDIRKEELEEEKMILYRGLEDAMHSMSHFSSIIEDNNINEAKALNNIFFNPNDGNIAFLINIAKAYFPDGTYGHASINGVRFFNKFRKILREHKEEYLNGDNKDWAITNKHYDYIKLVLEKDPDNKK